jgi:hypothetical protein
VTPIFSATPRLIDLYPLTISNIFYKHFVFVEDDDREKPSFFLGEFLSEEMILIKSVIIMGKKRAY